MKQLFTQLDEQLRIIQATPAPEQVLDVVGLLLQLLGIQVSPHQRELSLYKEVQDMSYLIKAPGYTDKKAVYEYTDTTHGLEVRVFFCSKIKKAHIAKGVALTPNFEDFPLDKPVNFSKPVSLDFFVEASTGEIVVVTSSEYQLRTMNLKGVLRNTQKTILDKWSPWEVMTGTAKEDIAIKARNHKILRDSLSLKELNKQFYIGDRQHPGIITFFTELKQHILEKHSHGAITFDDKYASQFVARLFGRIIFCEFLRKKGLINEAYGYYTLEGSSAQYYQSKLQYLFFEVLNTEQESRKVPGFAHDIDMHTPFLNGGLFEAKETDFYGQGIISFPDDFFHRFYGFLESYNFTTDESSSDYQQVAIDPEMLGRIFENLLAEESTETGEQARKAKGAFYTPREIVDYMCRESLRQYLLDALGESPNKEKTVQVLMDTKDHAWDRNKVADIKDHKVLLIQALDVCTIIDPACGSGAFPMGMVQLMTRLYERLDPKYDAYKVKFSIIKNSIYGVDIEPMAVEISRLRAWLSLIVDEDYQPQQKNGGIDPLPNLDFKFVCANSLIKLEKDIHGGWGKEVVDQLKEIRSAYLTASPSKKKGLQKKYISIIEEQKHSFAYTTSQSLQQIVSFDPFDASSSAGFFDAEFMFGVPGFSIVIGNPPYVQIQKMSGQQIQKDYEAQKYKTFTKMGDLYCLFYERGIELLREGGFLMYITSNKWMRAGYGEGMRSYFAQNTNPLILIDLGPNVFESATVDSNILLTQRKHVDKFKLKGISLKIEKNLDSLYKYHDQMVDMKNLGSGAWMILSSIEQSIREKIEKSGTPLKEWNISINYGIKTGFNEAFVISGEKKDELIKKDPKSAEIIRPILRGKDIKRYGYDFADLWLLYIPWHFPLHNDPSIQGSSEKAELAFKENYSAVYNHLLQYKKQLSNRNKAETGVRYERYALQRWGANYMDDFFKQKIVWNRIASEKIFGLVEEGVFISDSMHFIVGSHLEYICAILNSKVIQWLLSAIIGETAGGNAGNAENVTNLQLPVITTIYEEKIQGLLEKKDYDGIDRFTYDSYGLNEDEIKFISSSVNQ